MTRRRRLRLRKYMREVKWAAEKEVVVREARIALLGSQVAAAHFDAGQMAEREEEARR